jgi:hypothetical protein
MGGLETSFHIQAAMRLRAAGSLANEATSIVDHLVFATPTHFDLVVDLRSPID